MSRSVAWRRTISDAASWHQDQALNATIYILRETGPTGFLLKEEGESKKFKVFLGDPHKCNCSVFTKEKDLCKHICWLLLKKFRIPRTNQATWQLGLVEREINEILRGRMAKEAPQRTAPVKKLPSSAPDGRPALEQRDIGSDDVCPICQEGLLSKHEPVTYCKYGCANSIHIKCMKVWAEHQKSSNEKCIKCPFCREDFGPFEMLKQEFRNSSIGEPRARNVDEHYGIDCKRCHISPITGKCYKCLVCFSYHLCQECFNTQTHTEHKFHFRQKPAQRWRPADRGSGTALPSAVVNSLMNREIGDNDYDLLLQLDSDASNRASDIPENIIKGFPMERVREKGSLLAPGQQCRICLRGYQVGDHLRKLPVCKHKFHMQCIDNWLLHQHATCPVDGQLVWSPIMEQLEAATRSRQSMNTQSNGSNSSTGDLVLEIPGIGLARKPNTSVITDVSALSDSGPRSANHHNSGPMNFELNGIRFDLSSASIQPSQSHTRGAQRGRNNHLGALSQGNRTLPNASSHVPSVPLPHSQVTLVAGQLRNAPPDGRDAASAPPVVQRPPIHGRNTTRMLHSTDSDPETTRHRRSIRDTVSADKRARSFSGSRQRSSSRERTNRTLIIRKSNQSEDNVNHNDLFLGNDPRTVSNDFLANVLQRGRRPSNINSGNRTIQSAFLPSNSIELTGNALAGLTLSDLVRD